MQFDLSMDSGGKIPFGAQAYDKEERVVGMVDNLSRLLVFGIEDQGACPFAGAMAPVPSTISCRPGTRT